MRARSCHGVSLMELIAVIIIVGILAAVAIPSYNTSRERALSQEARANLKLIAAAEKIYHMETGNYYFSSSLPSINSTLKLSLTGTNWSYSITNANTFTAYAQRVAGYGSYSNCIYSLPYNDADGEPNPNSTGYCPP